MHVDNNAALIAAAILLGQQQGTLDANKIKELVEIASQIYRTAGTHTNS